MAEPSKATMLDPAHRPTAPVRGQRRGNSLPPLIVISAFILFGAAFLYDASAGSEQDTETGDKVTSGLPIADRVMHGYEAGEVPSRSPGAQQDPSFDTLSGAFADGVPVSGAHTSRRFPGPPAAAPRLPGLEGSDAGLGMDGAMPVMGPGSDALPDDKATELAEQRLAQLQEALRAGTRVSAQPGDQERSAGSSVNGLTSISAELARQAAAGGESYLEKLKQLKQAGLLGGDDNKPAKVQDAYARFAGEPDEDRWHLAASQERPAPYALLTGAVIPATLQTGINSDLPGQITAMVSQDVRDTATGRAILIPQGARLIGAYGANVHMGQERILVAWQRIIWPDGKSMDIGAMPGTDSAGYAGLHDQVNTHFWRMITSAVLLSGVTGGIGLSQGEFASQNGAQTVSGVMAQALGQQLGQVTEELIGKQMSLAPTLEIRPGYRLNATVTKDLVFNGPYVPFDYQRVIRAGDQLHRTGQR